MVAANCLMKQSCYTKKQKQIFSARLNNKINRLLSVGYSDADFTGHISRKSKTPSLWMFAGSAVTWNSKLVRTVLLSTTEEEYLAFLYNAKEAGWITNLLFEIGYTNELEYLKVHGDNKAAIELMKNPVFHAKTNHIDMAGYYVRELADLTELPLSISTQKCSSLIT